MTKSQKNKSTNPRPGYHLTKLGWLPEEWEVVTLEEIVSKKISYGIVQAGPHVENGQPYIKSSDLKGDLQPDSLQKTSKIIAEKYKRSTVVPGDIVFSLRGDVGISKLVPDYLRIANLTQGTARITSNLASNAFIREVLNHPDVNNRLQAVSKGSTFKEISLEDLRKTKIPLPPLPEQTRIATVLTAWDRAITITRQLIDQLETRKKGLMQQLLTGRKRLPGFSSAAASGGVGEWEEKRLGELLKEVKAEPVIEAHQYELVTVKLYSKGIEQTGKYPTPTEKARPYYFRKPGEIMIGRQNFHNGSIGIVPDFQKKVVASNALSSFLPTKKVVKDFVVFRLMEPNFYKRAGHRIGGTGQKEISRKEFNTLKINLPPLPEQRAIAAVLTAADREIALYKEKLATLETQKRGLMQQLLTGQKRLSV